MDAPTSACPNCGTPRGPYDRFCTGCAADLGAPGSPIGVVGTLGVMNVAGPSSGQARGQGAPAPRTAAGWVVPGVRSRPVPPGPASWVAPGGQPGGSGAYPATAVSQAAADRLWRTLGIANRLAAIVWLAFVVAGLASFLEVRTNTEAVVPALLVIVLFAIPSLALWMSAPRLMTGDPPWLRTIVVLEWAVIVVFTFGLALVPLLVIFVLAGDGGETA